MRQLVKSITTKHQKSNLNFNYFSFGRIKHMSYHTPATKHPATLKKIALDAIFHSLESVKPHPLLHQTVHFYHENKFLKIETETNVFEKEIESIYDVVVLGAGKASGAMCEGLIEVLGDRFKNIRGIVNVPHGQNFPNKIGTPPNVSVVINFSAHPTPDENGLRGAKQMVELASTCGPSTLVFVLISGGGSALLPLPADNLTLADLQQTNSLLLKSGAAIEEVNTVRKHIDALKGGQLARIITQNGALCLSLILSDVVGDDLQFIASGPTAPDVTTFNDALTICKKYEICEYLPPSVLAHLEKGVRGEIQENPKPSNLIFHEKVKNFLIGSAKTSASAVQTYLRDIHEFDYIHIFSNSLSGEASKFGKNLASLIQSMIATAPPEAKRLAFVGTGEFTVTIKGKGIGGRNQEMLLGFLIELKNLLKIATKNNELFLSDFDFVVCSAAFDGIEGNSPAMGGIVDNTSLSRSDNLNLESFLSTNDSFSLFNSLGDAIIVGQTGTNVNDMLLILLQRKNNNYNIKLNKCKL